MVGNVALAGGPADPQATGRPWQSRVPILLGVPAILALLFLVLPLLGLLIKAPWGDAGSRPDQPWRAAGTTAFHDHRHSFHDHCRDHWVSRWPGCWPDPACVPPRCYVP